MESSQQQVIRSRVYPRDLVRSRHKLQVAVLLCGIVVCLDIMWDPVPTTGYESFPTPSEPIVLRPDHGIQVEQEMSLTHQAMFSNREFERLTGNMHIWAHIQTLEAGGLLGVVTYFKFKTSEDARLVYEKMEETAMFPDESKPSVLTRRFLFGYYITVVRTLEDGNEGKRFLLPVYDALCIRAQEAKHYGL